ncbi:cold-shock protein [Kitasatospora camelliae]|uniref:Cold shock domain-containing protein n=1 Tax=Kitasatospora camelliae TaxID=3156397 RepID=A0AAU8K2S8_9ACTN
MSTGTVKWFNIHHAYGYITPDHGGPELAVYYDSIVGEDHLLHEGQRVEYEETQQEFRAVAEHVRPV